MTPMMRDGDWKVVGNCCVVLCEKCKASGGKKERIVVTEKCSEEYAKYVASKFPEYQAEAVQS